jgi:thiamine biosynthesis lipoprotein
MNAKYLNFYKKTILMKWLNGFILASLLVTGTSSTLPSSAGIKENTQLYVSHFENVLGTSMELKVMAASQKDASNAETASMKEIARLAKILSAYDANSEFSRWLRTEGQPIHVSAELFEVLTLFDQWRLKSGGALDASAEVIGKLWKTAASQQRLPAKEELDMAVAEVRQPHWKLDAATQTATHLSHAPLMLNSFAKSYIIRRAADAAMTSVGIRAVVVNIGGDLVISGDLKETVQISDPKADAENDAPIDQLLVGNKAVATSGNYRRGELINGHWYSHIVDPRTGQPADEVISATVVARRATDAGALATAFNVLRPSESAKLAESVPDAEYLIITRSGERIASKGWNALESTGAVQFPIRHDASAKKLLTLPWANDFELLVSLEINLQKAGFVKRPYVAVWVEDENHAPVRTIAVWHQNDRYLPELKSWFLKYRGLYSTDKSVLGSVSGATRSSGKYSMKWDGKDDKGNFVKPGIYTIKIEASREHGTYQLMRQELDCNETPKLINLPGNVEISAASLDYRKRTEGN